MASVNLEVLVNEAAAAEAVGRQEGAEVHGAEVVLLAALVATRMATHYLVLQRMK